MSKKSWPLRVPIYCAELDEFTGQYVCACEGGFQLLVSKGDVYIAQKKHTRTISRSIAGFAEYVSIEKCILGKTDTITGKRIELPFEPGSIKLYVLMMSNDPRLEKIVSAREYKFCEKNNLIMGIMGATMVNIDESAAKSHSALSRLKHHG